jgi:hypothetical protein
MENEELDIQAIADSFLPDLEDEKDEDNDDTGIQSVADSFLPEEKEEPVIPYPDTVVNGKSMNLSGVDTSSKDETSEENIEQEGFSTSSYDDMSYVEANNKFTEYAATVDDPDSPFSFNFGSLVYTDKDGKKTFVPRPEPRTWDVAKSLWPFNDFNFEDIRAKVPLTSVAYLGTRESGYDALELVASGVDFFGELVGIDTNDRLGAFQKDSVRVETGDSIIDAIVADGFPALLAGGGTGALVFKSLKHAPTILRGMASAVSGEVAATATTGTDEGTLWLDFGPEDMGLAEDEKGKLIAHRMNTFMEGMILGGAFTGAALTVKAGGMAAYDFLGKGIVDMFRGRPAVEREIYQKVSISLGGLTSKSTPQEVAAVQAEIAEIVKNNKEVIVRSLADLEKERPQTFDTVTALLRGNSENLNPSNLRGNRAGVVNESGTTPIQMTDGTSTTLNDQVNAPVNAIQDDLAAQRQALGGGEGTVVTQVNPQVLPADQAVMQDAADVVVNQSRRVVDEAQGGLEAAQAKFDADVDAVLANRADDIEMMAALEELQKKYPDELADVQLEGVGTIKSDVRNAYEAIKNEKDRLYREVEGGAVDSEGLVETLESLDPSYFDPARLGLPPKSMFGNFMNKFKSTKAQVDNLLKEADSISAKLANPKSKNKEALQNRLDEIDSIVGGDPDAAVKKLMADFIEGEGLTFGDLYTDIRPAISRAASDLFSASTPESKAAGRVMREFISYIDNDALDFAAQSDAGLKEAADAAKSFYQNNYADFFGGDSVLARYANLYDSTIGRTPGTNLTAKATGKEFGVREYNEKLNTLVNGEVLGSGNEDIFQNVADLLGKNLNGEQLGNPDLLFDYMMFDVIQNFHSKVRTGGMKAVDVEAMLNQLNKHATVVSKVFPEKTASIRKFIDELEAVKGSSTDLETKLATASENATVAKSKLYDSILSKFWDNKGTPKASEIAAGSEIRPTSNPYENFATIFRDPQAVNRLDDLMAEIDALPKGNYAKSEGEIVMDGLKLSFNKFIDDKIFTAARNLTGGKELSVAQADKILEDVRTPQVMALARKIYKDCPEWVEALENTLDFARDAAINKRATPNPSQSATNFNANAQTATNRLIYTFIGPLSRTGTKLKALGSGVINKYDTNQLAAEVTAQLYADPDYFLELARRFNSNPKDPLLEQLMVRYLFGGIIKTDLDDDSENRSDAIKDVGSGIASKVTPDFIESGFTSVSDAVPVITDALGIPTTE